ncbi:MAG TPA: hypothetical protein VKA70_08830 [Blastocatellia bacterium]|nr:hypothetical protein [Blastocatellia bacterium]
MRKPSKRFVLFTAISAVVITILSALPNWSQTARIQPNQNKKAKPIDEKAIPTVGYDEAVRHQRKESTIEPQHLELRTLRNSRYDNQVWVQKDEQSSEVLSTGHWWQGLSALPVDQSDAIVIGEITTSQAYLSNDKSGVYSEFTIRIDETLKSPNSAALAPGDIIVGERAGGAVKFSSGRITRYTLLGQGFPRPGRRYVLFLRMNEAGQDFHILTGYQLRRGKVQPLDQKDIFSPYEGYDQTGLLDDIRNGLAQAEQKPAKGGIIR